MNRVIAPQHILHDLADHAPHDVAVRNQQLEDGVRASYAHYGRGCVVFIRYADARVPTFLAYVSTHRWPSVLTHLRAEVQTILATYDPATHYVVVQGHVCTGSTHLSNEHIRLYPFLTLNARVVGA